VPQPNEPDPLSTDEDDTILTRAFFWMTHGHRPQQNALISVKKNFGDAVRTIGSRFDRRFDLVPADVVWQEPEDDDAFVDMVEQRGGTLSSAFGVPVVLAAMKRREVLVRHSVRLEKAGVVVLGGALEESVLDLCEDKMNFATFMKERFPAHAVPSRLVSSLAELNAAVEAVEIEGGQACVKPPVGVFGRGFWRLVRGARPATVFSGDPRFEEERILPFEVFASLFESDPIPVVVMPFLEGEEISIDALFRAGRLVRSSTRRKMGSVQEIGSDASLLFPALGPLGEALGLNGIVNLQIRKPKDVAGETYRLLEINTRYAGGTAYLVTAGIDLFSDAVAAVAGLSYDRSAPVPIVDIAMRAEPSRPAVSVSVPWSAS
jgi:hypothetical protein